MQRAAINLYKPKLPGAALSVLNECCQISTKNSTASKNCQTNPLPTNPIMSSDTSEFIKKHFSALEEEEEEFTSSHSRTHSQLPGQLEAEEARELEEALRLSAQEAMDRQRKKHKAAPKPTHEKGESSTASVTPRKRKASSETSAQP